MGQGAFSYNALSQEEKQLITESYKKLRGKTATFAALFFTNMFNDYPGFGNHFNFGLNNRKEFEKHTDAFMTEISWWVSCLHKEKRIKDLLERNAQRHINRNVKVEEYDGLKKTFVTTLKITLKDEFPENTEKAWNKALQMAFGFVFQELTKAKNK